jgi:hypothetical protein
MLNLIAHNKRKSKIGGVIEKFLPRIFEIKKEKVTEAREFYNEDLHNLCSPLNIIRMIKQGDWMDKKFNLHGVEP